MQFRDLKKQYENLKCTLKGANIWDEVKDRLNDDAA